MSKSRLLVLRRRIDRIDGKLAGLLEKRYRLVSVVGTYKNKENIPVADPLREKEIMDGIISRVRNDEAVQFIRMVYEGIFRASRAIEDERRKEDG